MDLTRVVTVGVQSDPLESSDLDGSLESSPVSPCQSSLMMEGCDGNCLADSSVEEVVVVADNASNSLSGMDSLDSQGSQEAMLAPPYFLAPCVDDAIPDRSSFDNEPTLVLSLQDDHDSMPGDTGAAKIEFDDVRELSLLHLALENGYLGGGRSYAPMIYSINQSLLL